MKKRAIFLLIFLWYSNVDCSSQVLKNGLKVITSYNDLSEVVSLTIFSGGGLINEDEKIASVATLVQNTLFEGTKKRNAAEIRKETAEIGAKIEKKVEFDHSYITFITSKRNFPILLDIVVDIISHPLFLDLNLKKQKNLLAGEIKNKKGNHIQDAYWLAMKELYQNPRLLWGEYPPEDIVLQIDKSKIWEWYKKFYSPPNLIISISGNFNQGDLQKKFRELESIPPQERVLFNPPEEKEGGGVTLKKNIDFSLLMLISPALPKNLSEATTLQIISHLIESEKIDVIYNFTTKLSLAYHLGVNFTRNSIMLYALCSPPNLEKVKSALLWEIAKIKQKEISEDTIEEAKDYIINNYYLEKQENNLYSYQMALSEFLGEGYKFRENYPEIIKDISAHQIKDIAQIYLKKFYVVKVTPY